MKRIPAKACGLALLVSLLALPSARAEETKVELGKLVLTAPEGWVKVQPKSRIVQYEFSLPKVEGDEADGRLTIMRAGGSVDANVARWLASFRQPDGGDTKERADVSKKDVTGGTLHLVDVTGTYVAPPFAGGGTYEKYRMLGAIIEAKDGMYFLKLLGPEKTLAKFDKGFVKALENVKAK